MVETEQKTDREQAKEVSDRIAKAVTDFQSGFKCERCGKCCQEGVGVALWPHEFQKLKRLEPHIYKHIVILNNWYALKLPCVFYNSKKRKCNIYDKRPIACRMYPLGVYPDGSTKISAQCQSASKLTTLIGGVADGRKNLALVY